MVLIALLYIIFINVVEPVPPPEGTAQDSIAQSQTPTDTISGNSSGKEGGDAKHYEQAQGETRRPAGTLFAQSSTEETFETLENDVFKLTFSNKGGRLYRAELKQYVTHDSMPLVLMDGKHNRFDYEFFLNNKAVYTQDYHFEAEKKGNNEVVFKLYADSARTKSIEQVYTIGENKNPYIVDYKVYFKGFDSPDGGIRHDEIITLVRQNDLIRQEKDYKTSKNTTGVYYREKGDDATYLSETSEDNIQLSSSVDWVAFKQPFFNNTLIAKNSFYSADLAIKDPMNDENERLLETATSKLRFLYKKQRDFSFPMQLYLGPNDYADLKKLDLGMEDMIPLGWGIFGWVNKWIIIPIFNFLNRFIGNYGLIILILTVFIKLVLSPLTYKSYKSFAKMNVLKPELEELKAKHGKDPARMQQEQMKLYSKAGVNPLGGCLPQLIQMPILIAMYRFFPASIELRQQSFLWADDLSTYDNIMNLPFSIPFYGDHVSLFCLLSAASSLIYMKINQQMTPTATEGPMATQMKIMQYFMPVMLLFFFNSFAAGLTYYFFLSNVFSFGQQLAIKKFFINEEEIHRQLQENKKKPAKQSKFQQRLEEMVKAQQEQQKQLKQGKGGSNNAGGNKSRRERRKRKK